ncbi:hypothetical protein L7D45_22115 [Brucella pseudogrignonensis]|nr:hypothetical protein [Brucella pseudogrignonensis]MBK0022854.1 hypothetical protein [Ochrobactrum sp. S45]MBK0044869.1 hypothetical protein [Ochrobactrum sp. S46]UKK95379.1 hypothetical protein L7D45_22115 [Brucella pseudogrignonensis]
MAVKEIARRAFDAETAMLQSWIRNKQTFWRSGKIVACFEGNACQKRK